VPNVNGLEDVKVGIVQVVVKAMRNTIGTDNKLLKTAKLTS